MRRAAAEAITVLLCDLGPGLENETVTPVPLVDAIERVLESRRHDKVKPARDAIGTALSVVDALRRYAAEKLPLHDVAMWRRWVRTELGEEVGLLGEDGRAALRGGCVGFVFQSFQLLPALTALENVMLPIELKGDAQARSKASALLERVGLAERVTHYPNQLSGGEQQRVAIARAFATEAKILFADEPTGNLDQETGRVVENLLFEMQRETNTTVILVTHDLDLAQKADRILEMSGGRLSERS